MNEYSVTNYPRTNFTLLNILHTHKMASKGRLKSRTTNLAEYYPNISLGMVAYTRAPVSPFAPSVIIGEIGGINLGHVATSPQPNAISAALALINCGLRLDERPYGASIGLELATLTDGVSALRMYNNTSCLSQRELRPAVTARTRITCSH
jgi:hypothetical protein